MYSGSLRSNVGLLSRRLAKNARISWIACTPVFIGIWKSIKMALIGFNKRGDDSSELAAVNL